MQSLGFKVIQNPTNVYSEASLLFKLHVAKWSRYFNSKILTEALSQGEEFLLFLSYLSVFKVDQLNMCPKIMAQVLLQLTLNFTKVYIEAQSRLIKTRECESIMGCLKVENHVVTANCPKYKKAF